MLSAGFSAALDSNKYFRCHWPTQVPQPSLGDPQVRSRNILSMGTLLGSDVFASSHFKGEFEDKPQSEKLRQYGREHVHGDFAIDFQ